MRYDEFLARIRDDSNIADLDHAEQAVWATLDVLGQRLSGGEAADLAAQLPAELTDLLTPHSGDAEGFDVEEFFRRVAARESRGCGPDEAREHARAVLSTVAASVTPGELEDFRSQLPAGYNVLLD